MDELLWFAWWGALCTISGLRRSPHTTSSPILHTAVQQCNGLINSTLLQYYTFSLDLGVWVCFKYGTGDTTKTDECSGKFQRGVVIFNTKIYNADFGPVLYTRLKRGLFGKKMQLDPVGSTVRYKMMKLCTGSV